MQDRPQNHPTHRWGSWVFIHRLLRDRTAPEVSVPALLPGAPVRASGLVVLDKSPQDTEMASADGSLPNIAVSPKGMVTASTNLLLPLPQVTPWTAAAPVPVPTASSNLPLLLFGGPCPIPSHSLPTAGNICHAFLATQH